ncbi:DUF4190 domain-containing protein [Pseudosporangium ferrugineum]|uniref:Plastocyanin n=1 Tax=Pseudosporangium ferrugineum TaxID=439699 RepID=A0A2T0RIP7_9ACTN|nr:DUF4190 domain-containing protein [Pseudosporangium ferrugineum]PRY21029.1 hypothetical protein CLV70_12130 [Pseudosporangium ferrugineum]
MTARGRARVAPPPGVTFGNVGAGGNVSQAGRDIHNVQYQHHAPDYYEHAKRFCALAVAAFLLSIIGLWPAALPVGYAARRRIRRTREGGGGLVTAALVISWSMAILTGLFVLAMVTLSRDLASGIGPMSPQAGHAPVREQRIRITSGPGWPEFLPRSATLGRGSTVVWVNERDARCALVATDGDLPRGVGTNPIRGGATYRITFTEPGMYAFACEGDLASGGTVIIR